MTLDLDVQLQVALRALEETVAPALGNAEKHVVEQLHLAIATIGFVKTRLPDARRYARMELAAYLELAEQSLACAGDDSELAASVSSGRAILDSVEADSAGIAAATRALRDGVTALGSRTQDPAVRAALDALVLDRGGAIVAQAQQWASPFGFELKPEDLPPPAW